MDEVGKVRALRYIFAEDGTLLLVLDCEVPRDGAVLTFGELRSELNCLCWWQLRHPVMIGLRHSIADVVTLYHAFEYSQAGMNSLMLVSTPPDEYFETLAA